MRKDDQTPISLYTHPISTTLLIHDYKSNLFNKDVTVFMIVPPSPLPFLHNCTVSHSFSRRSETVWAFQQLHQCLMTALMLIGERLVSYNIIVITGRDTQHVIMILYVYQHNAILVAQFNHMLVTTMYTIMETFLTQKTLEELTQTSLH